MDTTLQASWDASPTDHFSESDVTTWVDSYRRRLHATPIPGRTGRRDRTLLLAISHLMTVQGERVVHATYPDLVRVSALTHHTVLSAVIACREVDLLRVLGYEDVRRLGRGEAGRVWRFALMPDALTPDDGAEPVAVPLPRMVEGNLAHDAFGGRRGIKPTHRALMDWIAAHPGCTLPEVGQSGVAPRSTCYRAWNQLVSLGIAHLDAAGCCGLSGNNEGALLSGVVERQGLQGAMERRVDHATMGNRTWPLGRAGHWGMPR